MVWKTRGGSQTSGLDRPAERGAYCGHAGHLHAPGPHQHRLHLQGPLPHRLAQCTPDTKAAIEAVARDLAGLGFGIRLSDLFRSHDMQAQSHADFVEGRKKAFSPPPGGSLHEAGRAMDIDLSSIGVPLPQVLGDRQGARLHARSSTRRIRTGRNPGTSIVAAVTTRYTSTCRPGRRAPCSRPIRRWRRARLLAIGVKLDVIPAQERRRSCKPALIRLGFDPGRIDGVQGNRTMRALEAAGADLHDPITWLSEALRKMYPAEYAL